MLSYDVIVEYDGWSCIDLAAICARVGEAIVAPLGLEGDFEISLLAANDARIKELNGEFRDKDQATNVLSWPSIDLACEEDGGQPHMDQADEEPGDIALAFETCQREAVAQGKPFEHHVTHLIVHGTLHLFGFDHIRDGDAELMESLECRILDFLNIPAPY